MIERKPSPRDPYEVLGVSKDADPAEIQEAYLFLVATYGSDAVAVYRAIEETTRRQVMQEIEDAYQVLVQSSPTAAVAVGPSSQESGDSRHPAPGFPASRRIGLLSRVKSLLKDESAKPGKPEPSNPIPRSTTGLTVGETLRGVRKARGLSISAVASSTRIKVEYLEAIEQDQYDQLPPGSYRRLMLIAYARCLNLRSEGLLEKFPSD